MVSSSNGPRHGQLTTGIHLTRQHISHAVATLLTRLPGTKNSVGTIAPRTGFHDAAAVDNHDNGFAGSTELTAHAEYHVLLDLRQVELAINLAVHTLTSLTADGYNGCIGLLDFVGHAAV